LIRAYSDNVVDGRIMESYEESMKNAHLAGVYQHLVLFSSAESFAGSQISMAKSHHRAHCRKHLNELEQFYSGMRLHQVRNARSALENYLIFTQSI
jgi:hypothetical protein